MFLTPEYKESSFKVSLKESIDKFCWTKEVTKEVIKVEKVIVTEGGSDRVGLAWEMIKGLGRE